MNRKTIGEAVFWSEIPLSSDGFLFDLLEPWDIRALSISKTEYLPLQLCVGTFPRFMTIINETIFFYMRQQFTKCQWRLKNL
jgi:hypothetical protein